MELFWSFFEIIVTVVEAFISTHFVLSFQKYNYNTMSAKIKYVCASIGTALIIIVMNCFIPFEGLLGLIYTAYFFVISISIADSKIYMKILAAAIGNLVMLAVTSAVSNIVSAVFKAPLESLYTENTIMRFFSVIAAQLLIAFVYDVILRLFGNDELRLNIREWSLVLPVFIISFVAFGFIQTAAVNSKSDYNPLLLLAAEICIMLSAVVCFYMTVLISKKQKEAEQLKLLSQQNIYRAKYADSIKKQYDDIHRTRHDMKQAYEVIVTLLKDGKTDETISFIQKNIQPLADGEAVIDVGNDFVNAILNTKLSSAKQQGIKLLCSVDKNALEFDEIDLCNLLGNMLDNAIEACLKCQENARVIEITIKSLENQYFVEVANSVSCNVLETNSALKTTKSDPANHGFGVHSIREITKKYNGDVQFFQQGNIFRCDVVLMK